MNKQKGTIFALLVTITIIITSLVNTQETKQSEREALFSLYATKMPVPFLLRKQLVEHIQGGIIEPHWMADDNSFWYVEGLPKNTVVYFVDPMANTKKELFDVARLREELTSVLGHTPPGQGVPFRNFTFVDQQKKIKFKVEGKEFILQLDTYTVSKASKASPEKKQQFQRRGNPFVSPDDLWVASIKDFNLWIRSIADQSKIQITNDGIKDHYWSLQRAEWSPDSSTIALLKIDERNVQKIPIVSWRSTPEKVDWIHYPRAGEPIPQREIYFVNVSSKQTLKVDKREEGDHWLGILGWRPDGSELFYKKVDRRWKKAEVMAASPIDGTSRIILDEGVPPGHFHMNPYGNFMFAPDETMFILQSEKDGWDQLSLYDYEGNLVRQLTKGQFVIIRLVTLEEKTGWIYFTGRNDPERPYDTHLYRINLDGKGLKRLTEATGKHDGPYGWTDTNQAIQFTPSKEFFIDTHSTMNRPPVAELRKADGTLLQVLSRANIDILKKRLKWSLPEEFVVKAADGETDLYGVIYKPYDFSPNKKYPVIEIIFEGEVVQRTFIPNPFGWQAQALAHQGFIVFIVDVRGTEGRGLSFYNAFREDFYGFLDDHVVALKQLAAERPYMDLGRVGVFGYSAGGHQALIAMLKAPEVYHVGIVGAPVLVDSYSGRATVIEPEIGLPEENPDGYKKFSLMKYAGNLKGKLLLIHATSDNLCPFSHTMKMIDALIRAGKAYDLIIFPDENHSLFSRPGNFVYSLQATRRYFVEHLKPEMGR